MRFLRLWKEGYSYCISLEERLPEVRYQIGVGIAATSLGYVPALLDKTNASIIELHVVSQPLSLLDA